MTRMARLRSGGVQPGIPVFFYGYATARSCPLLRRVAAMRDVLRAIANYEARVGSSSGAEHIRRAASTKIERQMGGQRAQGPIPTYKEPYSTYSSLLYLSSTGFTPRDHIDDGMACFGATGRSSRATECDPI